MKTTSLVGILLVVGAAYLAFKKNESENPPPPPPPEWVPKWTVGQVLLSYNLPNATWTVQSISYNPNGYQVMFSFAGSNESIFVDAANLESADIYAA